jgi:hypothetical protein
MAALAACGSGGQGPLSNLHADPIGFSMPLDVGQSGSISGPFVAKNTGSQSVTLDSVDLVGLPGGLASLGAYIVPYPEHPTGPRPRSATIGIVPGYAISPPGRSLHGAVVPPHAQIAIVLGVKPTKDGQFAWYAVNVGYHDGSNGYTLSTPWRLGSVLQKHPT